MHAGELAEVGVLHEDVEALALADVGAPVRGHVDDHLLADLPRGLVQVLEVLRDLGDVLHAAVGADDLVLEVFSPEAELHQVAQQVLVHHHELAAQYTARVDVARVRLETFVVAEDLCGAGGGHRGEQQAVAHTVLLHLLAQRVPLPTVARLHAPHVELQDAFAHRAAFVGLVRSFFDREVLAGGEGRVVDGLEDLAVQHFRLYAIERMAHEDEGIRQALHADADGAVAHVAAARFGDRVVVLVDDPVEVLRQLVGDAEELVVIELALLHELGQRDGAQVAHGHLVGAGVLDDLRAEVAALDGAQVLLVALAVGGVLEEDVGRAGLDLALEDLEPEVLRLDGAAALAGGLVAFVQRLELLSPGVGQAGALVGAHQGPLAALLHALHEEVGDPHGVEQVAGAHLFLAVVLLQLQEVEHVGVPGLQVHGEAAFALAAALVHVTGRVVEDAQHGHDAVAGAVGAFDVAALGAQVVHAEADATGALADLRALLQRVVDAGDAVVLQLQQEAAAHLRLGCARVEQGGRGVGVPAFAEGVVGGDGALDVALVDAHGHTHEHVLRTLHHLAVQAQEVAALEGLEAEVVVVEVAIVDDGAVQHVGVLLDDLVYIIGEQRGRCAGLRIDVGVEVLHGLAEGLLGVLVQIAHGDAARELRVIRVFHRHGGGHLGGEVVELGGGDTVEDAVDHLEGDLGGIHDGIQLVAQFLHPGGDLVELHCLPASVALDNVHVPCSLFLWKHSSRLLPLMIIPSLFSTVRWPPPSPFPERRRRSSSTVECELRGSPSAVSSRQFAVDGLKGIRLPTADCRLFLRSQRPT